MKQTIKIAIALAVIVIAYIIGKHQDDEKYQLKVEELNKNISLEKNNISHFQDSIIKLKQIIDSLKITPMNIAPQPKTNKRKTNNESIPPSPP